MAISFCDHGERAFLRDIEKIIRQRVPVIVDHPYHAAEIANDYGRAKGGPARKGPQRKKRQDQGQGHNQGQGQGRRKSRRTPRPGRQAA